MVLLYRQFNYDVLNGLFDDLEDRICGLFDNNAIMLSFTHGQPATPTSFSKELQVFVYSLYLHKNGYI